MADRGRFPSVAVDEEEGAVDGEVGVEDAPDDVLAVAEEEEGEAVEEEDGEDAGLVLDTADASLAFTFDSSVEVVAGV